MRDSVRAGATLGVAISAALSATGCGGGTTSAERSGFSSVTVAPPSRTLPVGESVQLTATVLDHNGSPVSAALVWTSSNQSVASVSESGLVTAASPGPATITVVATQGANTGSATAQVTVTAPRALTSVTISPPPALLMLGASVQLNATGRDQFGDPITASIAWVSAPPGVVSVTPAGLVTGIGVGVATITATASAGGVSVGGNAQVTVSDAPPRLTSVTIGAPATTMNVGGMLQLSSTSRDQYGAVISANVSWSSSNGGVASVSGTGLVTGVSGGSATITATAVASGITATADVGLTVVALPTSAQVSATTGNAFVPGSVEIARGGSVTWTFATVHNVTFAGTLGAPANIGDTGGGGVSRTFSTAGTFNYECTLHPGMSGSVTVH